jgi:hypothetical protein
MITWADVVAIAPELSTVATASQNAILAMADRQIDEESWSDLADDGRKLLAAHLATLLLNNRGLVTQETLGPLSRSYALPPGIVGSFAMSSYGTEYRRLIGLLPSSLGFVP